MISRPEGYTSGACPTGGVAGACPIRCFGLSIPAMLSSPRSPHPGLRDARPELPPSSSAIHVWTVGAIGVTTLAEMTRATLAHSGRPLIALSGSPLLYLALIASPILRPLTGLDPSSAQALHTPSALGWPLAFPGIAVRYGKRHIRA
jgi:hypothetical protein